MCNGSKYWTSASGYLEKGSFDISKLGLLQIQVSLPNMNLAILCFYRYPNVRDCR
jgi:hypothetical protein